jgi:hypothetical protein
MLTVFRVEGTGPKLIMTCLGSICSLLPLILNHHIPCYLKMCSSQNMVSIYKVHGVKTPKDDTLNCVRLYNNASPQYIYLWNTQYHNRNQWMSPDNNPITILLPCVTSFTPTKTLNILCIIFHCVWPEFLNHVAFHLLHLKLHGGQIIRDGL